MKSSQWFELGDTSLRYNDIQTIALYKGVFGIEFYVEKNISHIYPNSIQLESVRYDKKILYFHICDDVEGAELNYYSGNEKTIGDMHMQISQCINILEKLGLSHRIEKLKQNYVLSKLDTL